MKRHAIRSSVLFVLLVAAVSTARAQVPQDVVEVRNRKDGSTKTYKGLLKVTPTGFQVFTGEKFDKPGEAFAPDDLVKVSIGDLPGVDRDAINSLKAKEEKKTTKDLAEAAAGYKALSKAGLADRSKRYLDYKTNALNQAVLDDLDPGKEWQDKADKLISEWKGFLADYKPAFGWEMWPAARAVTRLLVERGKYSDAAAVWANLRKAPELPPSARIEAGLQEMDFQIRAKAYSNAIVLAADPEMKKATGTRKEQLGIYEMTAKAGSDAKHLDGVDKVKAAMDKTKDPTVHATGYAMMGELYLAAGKPRDAMWMFLWVETVVNQDKDEVFKAIARLTELFTAQMDEDQTKKYREKIKRYRSLF
ncbi:MAG TPA: hypothetical protein VGE74_31730 [Gemmata sp.]